MHAESDAERDEHVRVHQHTSNELFRSGGNWTLLWHYEPR